MPANQILSRYCVTQHVQQVNPNDSVPTRVLFGHGFGCDQLIWTPLLAELPSTIAPVTFDFCGCGRSDFSYYDAETYSSFTGYVNDLIAVIEALECGPIHYVGHSVGGMIGMLASIKRPDLFRQIIAIGPSPRYLDTDNYQGGFKLDEINELLSLMERNHFEWAGYLAPIVMKNSHRPELSEQLRQSFANADPAISRRFAELVFLTDNRSLLPQITVPVSILYCDVDVIVPTAVIDYMAAKIPHCDTAKIGCSGHYPHVSSPQLVCDKIMACLLR